MKADAVIGKWRGDLIAAVSRKPVAIHRTVVMVLDGDPIAVRGTTLCGRDWYPVEPGRDLNHGRKCKLCIRLQRKKGASLEANVRGVHRWCAAHGYDDKVESVLKYWATVVS